MNAQLLLKIARMEEDIEILMAWKQKMDKFRTQKYAAVLCPDFKYDDHREIVR